MKLRVDLSLRIAKDRNAPWGTSYGLGYWNIFGSLLVAVLSTAAAFNSATQAGRSADATQEQIDWVKRKIGMVTDPEKMTEILPVCT